MSLEPTKTTPGQQNQAIRPFLTQKRDFAVLEPQYCHFWDENQICSFSRLWTTISAKMADFALHAKRHFHWPTQSPPKHCRPKTREQFPSKWAHEALRAMPFIWGKMFWLCLAAWPTWEAGPRTFLLDIFWVWEKEKRHPQNLQSAPSPRRKPCAMKESQRSTTLSGGVHNHQQELQQVLKLATREDRDVHQDHTKNS